MNTHTALESVSDLLTEWIIETSTPEENRLDLVIDASNLVTTIKALVSARWGYLAGITGLDPGEKAGFIEVLYHFCAKAAVVTLRLRTPREHASVPSITAVLPTASFYERELHEMMGVEVVGLSNLDHLFLPDDWTSDVYPLRKDAKLE